MSETGINKQNRVNLSIILTYKYRFPFEFEVKDFHMSIDIISNGVVVENVCSLPVLKDFDDDVWSF